MTKRAKLKLKFPAPNDYHIPSIISSWYVGGILALEGHLDKEDGLMFEEIPPPLSTKAGVLTVLAFGGFTNAEHQFEVRTKRQPMMQ